MVFIPNFSTLKGEPQDPEENEKTYAESQEQRALERKLRAERRDLAVMKAQGESPEAIRKQQERVKTASAEIDDFCDRTGRARRKLREYTPIDAKWPNKDSYDPQTFPHEQKDKLAEWFKNDNNNPPPTPTQIHLGPDNIPPMTQAQIPIDNAPQNVAQQTTQNSGNMIQFTPAKTVKEAEEYAKRFSGDVRYKGITLENCNKINETLTDLFNKYPQTKPYTLIEQSGRLKAVAAACWDELTINGKKIGQKDSGVFELNKKMDSYTIEEIKRRYSGRKIPPDMQKQITKLENNIKFKRWAFGTEYGIKGAIAHEFGHTIADQYIGQINDTRANPNANDAECYRLRQMIIDTKQKAWETGDIFNLSKYGNANEKEFFAEVFCAREMGETLPDYFVSMLDEVIAHAPM